MSTSSAPVTLTRTISECFADWWEGTIDLARVRFDPVSHTASLEIEFADYGREGNGAGSVFSTSFESPVLQDHAQFENVAQVDVDVRPREVQLLVNDIDYDGERLRIHGTQGTIAIHAPAACTITRADTNRISVRRVYLGGLFNWIAIRNAAP